MLHQHIQSASIMGMSVSNFVFYSFLESVWDGHVASAYSKHINKDDAKYNVAWKILISDLMEQFV